MGVFNISKGGTVNWASGGDDIRVMLLNGTGYTFNPDNDYVNDISSFEVNGAGYARKKVYNRTTVEVAASDKLQHNADDTVWASINAGSCDVAVYYIREGTGSDSLSQLISSNDFDSGVLTNGGQLTVQVDADGVYEGLPE